MIPCKISLVMPVYNVEKYLAFCLDSIIAQTFSKQEMEVIVVNDGSTDDSLTILEAYENKYPELIRVYTTENRGVSHARNYGVNKAVGEYVLFVDSDDFLEPDMCTLLYEKAEKDHNDVVICRYYDAYENEETGQFRKKESKAFEITIGRNFNIHETKFEMTHISPFPWDKLYRRSLLLKHPFPENLRFEDLSIMYCIMADTTSIGVIEERLYNYRRSNAASFLSTFSEGTLDIVTALQLFVKGMKAQEMYEEFYEEIEFICTRHILVRYNALFDVANKGNLELKKRLIHSAMDFLEENFMHWRSNRYLKYSASSASREKSIKYKNKQHMLRAVHVREYTPVKAAKAAARYKKLYKRLKDKIKKFQKIKNKVRFLMDKIPGMKLINMPKDVMYTMFYEKYPVNKKDVLFESKHGDDIAGNLFALLLEMKDEKYREFNVMVTLKESKIAVMSELLARYEIDFVTIVPTDEKSYLKALATAGYLITDTSFPPYFIKRDEQVYLNTWHGTPLKAMGRIVPNREYGLGNVQRNFYLADYLLYQNEFSRDIFVRDYMLAPLFQGQIMLSGYPRNSAFFNTDRYAVIREELSITDKQVFAYMPTWRGLLNKKENKKQIQELTNYFYHLDSLLKDDQILYVKLHPFVKTAIDYDNFIHIKAFPEQFETYDFLNATDGLITDYSSIMFDYAVSKKKIILFAYDREEYLATRGMYLDLNEVEFPIAKTVEELYEAMGKDVSYPEFHKKFCSHDSKDTAKQVAETLFFDKKPDFPIEKTSKDNKKNVLIFINGIWNNTATTELIDRLNHLDTSQVNYYISMKASKAKKGTAMLSQLKPEIGYIPLMFDVNYTIRDRLACINAFKFNRYTERAEKLLNELGNRERKKYYGDNRFDLVINLSSPDKVIFHMCQSFECPTVYNFKGLSLEKYLSEEKYREKMGYFAKRMQYYDYVTGNTELKDLDCKAVKENLVKLRLDDLEKVDLTALVKEVTKE